MFGGNRKNLLYIYLNLYPNYVEKLENNLEEIVLNVMNNNDKDIINLYIENSFMSLYKHTKYKNINYGNNPILKIINEYYENKKKCSLWINEKWKK